MKNLILSYLSLFILFAALSPAQNLDNLRCRNIDFTSDSIRLDSLSIIPGSIHIKDQDGNQISEELYKIDPSSSVLFFNDTSYLSNNSYTICYRVFPYDLSRKFYNKSKDIIEPDGSGSYNPFKSSSKKQSADIFEFDGLNKSGSISRGINFGNKQDVVVDANLNLQLSGKLSKDVEILAAITDNNMPIQPYGNTQYIQEFDKVFIQLSMKRSKLIAGDFELTSPQSYFMRYYKKLQGGDFKTKFDFKDKKNNQSGNTMNLHAAGALSKGKFARNNIQGLEGNQGPYRLRGNENEQYIIVLAGTEKVFIDGNLLTRGQENDYVIDYNTAEITFTPEILITKDKRITVEFEYSDKNYARSLFFVGSEFEAKLGSRKQNNLKIGFNFFSEQDIKNQSLQQDLTSDQKFLLSQIGDSINDAYIQNIDSVGFTTDEVLYFMTDTIVNNHYYDSIFVYPDKADSNAVYRVGFTLLGDNKGDYIQETSSVNGRVYKWVAPVDSVPQGNYKPITLLITPRKSQMLTISAEYSFSEKTKVMAEFVLSNSDINTFSGLDNNNNQGYGIKTQLLHTIKLSKNTNPKKTWSLISSLDYEWIDKNFKAIEPYRNVEFRRDWNITDDNITEDEHISTIALMLKNPETGFTSYSLQLFQNGSQYQAYRNNLNASFTKKGYHFSLEGSLLNTEDVEQNTRFVRSRTVFSKTLGHFTLGLSNAQEHNTFKTKEYDTLMPNSYSFNEFEIFITNPDTMKNKYLGFYKQRSDKSAGITELKKTTLAEEVGFTMKFLQKANNRINLNGTYRKLQILNETLTDQKADNNVVGRIEYLTKVLKGFIRFNLYYEIGSGQELKKEFSYLKVADGEGIYAWTDYNGDGIQQLNEFDIAKFKDQANYIRIYLPTDDYIKTYFNQFSNGLHIRPAAIIKSSGGFLKALARFSNQTIFQIEHKTSSDDPSIRFNPFISDAKIADTVLISMNSSFRNTLSFNKNNPRFGIDLSFQNNSSKALLVNGFDTRLLKSMHTVLRWKFNTNSTIFLDYTKANNISSSEFFSSRDYNIHKHEVQPKISWQPNSSVIVDVFYNYKIKTNKLSEANDSIQNEESHNHKLGIIINYKVVNKGNFQLGFDLLNITYNAVENTSLAYEMLEGFRTGNNASWNLAYQRNLSKYLQLNLVYNGRKSPDVKTVHIGSVQLRAYF